MRPPASFLQGLRANIAAHTSELDVSLELGYRPPVRIGGGGASCDCDAWAVPHAALGFGPDGGFFGGSDEHVFATRTPLLSSRACAAIVREAAAAIAGGARSTFSLLDSNRDAPVHELPRTQRVLNAALPRIGRLVGGCWTLRADAPTRLFVYRSLVIQYDAAARLLGQPIHRDGSVWSMIVPLNDGYEGGGTRIEALGRSIVIPTGHALLHPSALRHGGEPISGGVRWVLVAFLAATPMHWAEHGRRFKDRARELQDVDDAAAEYRVLLDALHVCPDDHELEYDAGCAALELGDAPRAARHLARAADLNAHDPAPLNNLGAAALELGDARAAVAAYRRALARDAHAADARLNLAGLLNALGRRRAAAALLRAAPPGSLDGEEDAADAARLLEEATA